jgi:superfamily II DNA helicase RecQ
LKKEQLEAVLSLVAGKDVFVSLPTGFGKSLCFAILPGVFNTLTASTSSIVVVITTPD